MMLLSSGVIVACLPSCTNEGKLLLGKNSERPSPEVQEVVQVPAQEHGGENKLQLTYIDVPQVAHTHGVVLSKPAWMWGAQMGVNKHSVAIGYNEMRGGPGDVTNGTSQEDGLIIADIVRLALERSTNAEEALEVMTSLLSAHPLTNYTLASPKPQPPHASVSIVIADRNMLWLLETVGKHWAAKKITTGAHILTAALTISTDADKLSDGIQDYARQNGKWNGEGDFDFAKAFGTETEAPSYVQTAREKLSNMEKEGNIGSGDVIKLLREMTRLDENDDWSTVASMVSAISSQETTPSIHWFTATPLPDWSMFKPVIFCDGLSIGSATLSPSYGPDDPVNTKPRFQNDVKREHLLWEEHSKLVKMIDAQPKKADFIREHMQELEGLCRQDIEETVKLWDGGASSNVAKAAHIFEHMIDLELNFLK